MKSLINLDSDASEAKETEAAHMLGAVAVLVPYLSKKARKTVFLDAYQLLSPCFSPLTRHLLRLMETLVENLKAENFESELESLISLVLAYLPYDEKKPDDTIVAALQLMRNCLAKLASHPKLWMEALPSAFEAVSGLHVYVFHVQHFNIILLLLRYTHVQLKKILTSFQLTHLSYCLWKIVSFSSYHHWCAACSPYTMYNNNVSTIYLVQVV